MVVLFATGSTVAAVPLQGDSDIGDEDAIDTGQTMAIDDVDENICDLESAMDIQEPAIDASNLTSELRSELPIAVELRMPAIGAIQPLGDNQVDRAVDDPANSAVLEANDNARDHHSVRVPACFEVA